MGTLILSACRGVFVIAALCLGLVGAPGRARAAFALTLQQVGNDVVLTGAGTINPSALEFAGHGNAQALIRPNNTGVYGGTTNGVTIDEYVGGGLSGPASFGSGDLELATSVSGGTVGVLGAYGYLLVPAGYVSGTPMTESATFANQSFASLGFTPRTYTCTRGEGAAADSLMVSGVPDPATWQGGALLALVGVRASRWGIRRA